MYEGYVDMKPHPQDPRLLIVTRLTDFASPHCDRPASDLATHLPFKGKAVQMFMITQQEGAILHQGR